MSCLHNMKYLEKSIFNNIYCKNCGSIIFKTENPNEELLLIKPDKFNKKIDIQSIFYCNFIFR